jgi:hypothetical protein
MLESPTLSLGPTVCYSGAGRACLATGVSLRGRCRTSWPTYAAGVGTPCSCSRTIRQCFSLFGAGFTPQRVSLTSRQDRHVRSSPQPWNHVQRCHPLRLGLQRKGGQVIWRVCWMGCAASWSKSREKQLSASSARYALSLSPLAGLSVLSCTSLSSNWCAGTGMRQAGKDWPQSHQPLGVCPGPAGPPSPSLWCAPLQVVDQRNAQDQTPLMLACQAGALECVRMLLEAGANATLVDGLQSTCLHNAARQGSVEVLELLLGDDSWVETADGGRVLLRSASIIDQQGRHRKASWAGSASLQRCVRFAPGDGANQPKLGC